MSPPVQHPDAPPEALPVPGRRRLLGLGAGLTVATLLPPGHAAVGGLPASVDHDASSREWETLREQRWGTRPIITGPDSRVRLAIPLRAAFGASVPIRISSTLPQTPERYVRRMTLLVDKNPSPVAIQLDLTPRIGQADFETRLRVDEYSHVRVLAEWSDDTLHLASRYVKVSGGCSAPPNRDQLAFIGRTVLRTPSGVHLGSVTPVDLSVIHPNDTGFELNQVTLLYIPPHFVRSLKVSYAGEPVLEAETEFSVSENPSLRFNFVPTQPGELRADVEDSKEVRYVGRLDVR